MKKRKTLLVRMLEWGTLIGAVGLIGTVVLQIVSRTFFAESAPSWTEEASRFFFIYAISFAAGLAQKDGEYVSMDYFYRKLSLQNRRRLDLITAGCSLILFIVMAVYSVQFIAIGFSETSPGLGLPMAFAFISMFVMSGAIAWFLLEQLYQTIKILRK
jgi:TRAP-type C4-dicarboxylate transport system permease small subunit